MKKIEGYIKKLESYTPERIEKDVLKIVKQNEAQIVDLNQEQLIFGKDSQDKSLGEYRSAAYAEYKRLLNPAGVVDLRLTGKFYRGFFVNADKFPVTVSSVDSKTDELTKKYGKAIFGLDKENTRKFMEETVKPKVLRYYRKIFRLRNDKA